MALWSSRTTGYKVGVLVLFLGAGLYLLGFAAPFWLHFDGRGADSFSGLWLGCYTLGSETHCTSVNGDLTPDWFKAIQAMQCLGLIGMFLSGAYALFVNCCQTSLSHNRFLEIFCVSAGIAGFIGCMIFAGKYHEADDYFGWAFGMNLTGCILLVIAGCVVFATNRADLSPPPTGTVIGAPPMQGVSSVTVHQGQMYPGNAYPPQQPGMGYVVQPGYGYPQQGYPQQGYPQQGYPQGYAAPAPGYAPPQAVGTPSGAPPQAASAPPPQAGYPTK